MTEIQVTVEDVEVIDIDVLVEAAEPIDINVLVEPFPPGPTGPTGPTGADSTVPGPAGTDGATILSGHGAPAFGSGLDPLDGVNDPWRWSPQFYGWIGPTYQVTWAEGDVIPALTSLPPGLAELSVWVSQETTLAKVLARTNPVFADENLQFDTTSVAYTLHFGDPFIGWPEIVVPETSYSIADLNEIVLPTDVEFPYAVGTEVRLCQTGQNPVDVTAGVGGTYTGLATIPGRPNTEDPVTLWLLTKTAADTWALTDYEPGHFEGIDNTLGHLLTAIADGTGIVFAVQAEPGYTGPTTVPDPDIDVRDLIGEQVVVVGPYEWLEEEIGVDGDFYVNEDATDWYGPKNGTWPAPVSLIGPQGEEGPTGPQGPEGDLDMADLATYFENGLV